MTGMKTRKRSHLKAQMTFADGSRVEILYKCSDATWNAAFAIINGAVPESVVDEYLAAKDAAKVEA